jgi:hypothetical protein
MTFERIVIIALFLLCSIEGYALFGVLSSKASQPEIRVKPIEVPVVVNLKTSASDVIQNPEFIKAIKEAVSQISFPSSPISSSANIEGFMGKIMNELEKYQTTLQSIQSNYPTSQNSSETHPQISSSYS